MKKRYYSVTGLILLVVLFLAFTVLNNALFTTARIDLTENKLYTISDGTKSIVDKIDEPVNLYFFFSDKASRDIPQLRNFANRVQELLEEYALYGGNKINLTIIDPEPFSEEEDKASGFGLQSVPLSLQGDEVYFGLVGTNALDNVEIISFFQPDHEELLEYDITKLIHTLANPKRPVVGLMSSLKMDGGFDMTTRQPIPAWVIYDQLKQLFDVRIISTDADTLEKDIDVLMVVHPKELSDSTQFAIDQFVLKGGKALIFVDPFSEIDIPSQMSMAQGPGDEVRASELNKLFAAWGVTMAADKAVLDAQHALMINMPQSRQPVRHLAMLSLGPDNLLADDVVTAGLENVNVAMAGILSSADGATTAFNSLIFTSENAMPSDSSIFGFMRNPEELQDDFTPTGEVYSLAASISGPAKTAFPDGVDGLENAAEERITESDNINVVVIADTDLLANRLWVQVQDFFGQQIVVPWADNASLVINALDHLSGSQELISIRSRGRFSRPFTVVDSLKREAEMRFKESEQVLQQQLTETDRKLTELQKTNEDANNMMISPEQEQALSRFQDEKLKIRKQLREVRHQLDKDIADLGTQLKLINIGVMPVLLTLLLWFFVHLRQRRQRASS